MSDCSTKAMTPKERPEVCPNCEKPMTKHLSEYEPSLVHLHCPSCDCSITLERKEPPKTCGNCGHFMRDTETKNMGICSVDYFETGAGVDVYAAAWKEMPCKCPSHYIERTDTTEQRYQQLEQLAVDMMHRIEYLELKYDAPTTSITARMYQQLGALGVSLDD